MSKRWVSKYLHMFTGAAQVANFRDMPAIFPVRVLRRSSEPRSLARGARIELPETHAFRGRKHDTAGFLRDTETTGLIVLRGGQCVYEQYWLGVDATVQWPTWSVIKSRLGLRRRHAAPRADHELGSALERRLFESALRPEPARCRDGRRFVRSGRCRLCP
jgi:hypothetical protein